MLKTYKYRVKGHRSGRLLTRMAAGVNLVWNYCGEHQKHALRWRKKFASGYQFNSLTAGCSKELGLPSATIQLVGQQYFRSTKIQKRNILRFRGKRALGWIPFKGHTVMMKAGKFRFFGHDFPVWLSRPVFGPFKSGSFSQDSRGNWYINVCVEVAATADCGEGQVGVDLGLKTTATMSDGQKYDGLRCYRAIEPKLAVAQRAHKKDRVKALHAKAKNRRFDGLHKLSTKLVDENRLVAVGNVSSQSLAKTRMAKSVYDAGWGMLRGFLRYKTIARGAEYREVNEVYSSQLCSKCGILPDSRPKGIAGLGIREWTCSNCGEGHDRDINAARNILALGCERPAEGITGVFCRYASRDESL